MKASPDSARPALGGLPFLIFGRVIPGAVFAVLASAQIQLLATELRSVYHGAFDIGAIALAFNRVLFLGFVGAIALIYVFRKPPVRGRHDPISFAASMYASFILLAVRPLADVMKVQVAFNWGDIATLLSDVLLISGFALSAYSLAFLRFNFSILPEARELVTSGPYRLVRHPIYLGEIVGAFGLVVILPSWFSLIVLITFVAAQVYRTRVEEGVLVEAIPGYAAYRQLTRYRLIPWVV